MAPVTEDEPELIDELAEDYVRRLRAGEAVTPEDYAAKHPDLAERIADLFPVLAMMEGLKSPAPGAGEVVLAVAAAALNRADLLQRQGFYPPPPGASDVIGMECSGTVAAVGTPSSASSVAEAWVGSTR